uniref:Putative RNA-directed DNA polymerase from transposon BS n=2 Tax=Lygus hesperus TaxID=30085 RepID=A0A146M6K4_LYGHE
MNDRLDFVNGEHDIDNNCQMYENLESYKEFTESNHLLLVQMNLRSYSKNFDEFCVWLESQSSVPDFIIFTEVWSESVGNLRPLAGYSVFQSENHRNRNDGVIFYGKSCYSYTVTQISLYNSTILRVDFKVKNTQYTILAVYRTGTGIQNFVADLVAEIKLIREENRYCIIAGDMNIDILSNSGDANDYFESLASLGLIQHITIPTRVTENSASCIDHMVSNLTHHRYVAGVIRCDITDHFATALSFAKENNVPIDACSPAKNKIEKKINFLKLEENLQNTNWDPVMVRDVNNSASAFVDLLKDIIERSSDEVKRYGFPKQKKLTPWITVGLVSAIRKRDDLKMKVSNQPFNRTLKGYYLKYRNLLKMLIREAKRDYFDKKFQQAEGCPSKEWKVLNEVLGRSNKSSQVCPFVSEIMKKAPISESSACIQACNVLNNYFCSVGENLATDIRNENPVLVNMAYHGSQSPSSSNTFVIPCIDEEHFVKICNQMQGKSAPGFDGIQATLIKKYIRFLAKPMIHLINLSISSSEFPDIFKTAKVVPLHKGGSKADPSNFRPISMLSVLSKILEKWVKQNLVAYLEDNNILSPFQYGFRSGRCVDDALFDLTSELYKIRDEKSKAILVCLDICKAFDSIDRGVLLQRMELIGVRGSSLAWFSSYLKERRQVVSIGNYVGDLRNIDYGVIQGSTLGPSLFLIYINSISAVIDSEKIFLFADDTALLIRGSNWHELFSRTQALLNRVSGWMVSSFLTVNGNKTKYMIFGNVTTLPPSLVLKLHSACPDTIQCNCACLESVSTYKYLGVMLDTSLSWSDHVEYMYGRLRKFIPILKNVRTAVSRERLRLIYVSFVQSVLQYAISIWGSASKTIMAKLNSLHRSILKVMYVKPPRHPSNLLHEETKTFTIKQLFVKELLLIFHRKPSIISFSMSHQYPTRFTLEQRVVNPRPALTLTTRSPHYLMYLIYNSLPADMKLPNSYSRTMYKKRIYSWLIHLGIEKCGNLLRSTYLT